MKTNVALRSLKILVLAGICALCIIPFYSLLVLSLNAPNRIFYEGNLFVPSFHFQNYADAWHKSKIGTAMLNSALITFGTLGLTILLGGMAGYAIARRRSVLNRMTFALLIGCMMIPGIINTVPLYSLMRRIQAVDTLWGMVLVCSPWHFPPPCSSIPRLSVRCHGSWTKRRLWTAATSSRRSGGSSFPCCALPPPLS